MPNKTAVWFKIAEQGRSADKKTWGTDPLTKPGNAGYTYTIPECIKAGHYLVRHELVALHDAAQYPGPQFYPGCHQIKVSGEGTTVPKSLGRMSFMMPARRSTLFLDLRFSSVLLRGCW